ncbi:MAG: YlbF family regulator [Clostridia bacterium]|nr:YlbF family regulator [Clostridia bacterium]
MQNYDKAYELARQMRSSETYQAYLKARDAAFENQMNKEIYKKYVEISRTVTALQMSGQQVDEKLQAEFNQLVGVLSLNGDMMAFLLAEHKLNQMIGDVFKIIGDAVEINLDFLKD